MNKFFWKQLICSEDILNCENDVLSKVNLSKGLKPPKVRAS